MKNTEIENNQNDFRAQLEERKLKYEALRQKRQDVMQEKIDEVNGIKSAKNIEFTKIVTKDTSDDNLAVIESKIRSIS